MLLILIVRNRKELFINSTYLISIVIINLIFLQELNLKLVIHKEELIKDNIVKTLLQTKYYHIVQSLHLYIHLHIQAKKYFMVHLKSNTRNQMKFLFHKFH